MTQEKGQNQNSVNTPGGLNTDNSLVNQPQGTTRFVLSGVNETSEGDIDFLANEESNSPCYTLPEGFIPMGKVYIGNEEHVLMLANPNGNSSIVIVDKECSLQLVFTDKDQEDKLGFSIENQIDVTFRLVRGCERTLYWIDPKPRSFILDKPEKFKNEIGEWDISKFSLAKTAQKIPIILDIEVLDGAGSLPPGSYNFSPQYLDEDFNPTEFITSSETVNIYNSPLSGTFRDIRGATKQVNEYLNHKNSNKAIKITFDPDSLDTAFPFYRLGITEANAGTGIISDTKYTAEISTKNNIFIYTGTNFESSGTQAEITMFNNVIEKAESIEQIENRLILGNVQGKQINYCKLQQFASQIAADMITRPIVLSSLVDGNPKDPSTHIHQTGYMPGEIYSFAIVYIFKDCTVTPAFHIPGKSPVVSAAKIYAPGDNVYPMTNSFNYCQDTQYLDNSTCESTSSYWGKDIEENELTNEPVRHHRFPLRTDLNIPFIEKVPQDIATTYVKRIKVEMSSSVVNIGPEVPNELSLPTTCEVEGTLGYDAACIETFFSPFTLEVGYVQDTLVHSYDTVIDPAYWALEYGEDISSLVVNKVVTSSTLVGTLVTLDPTAFFERNEDGTRTLLTGTTVGGIFTSDVSPKGVVYKISFIDATEEYSEDLVTSEMFGIKFSNIIVPTNIGPEEIIGYYIVRSERKEEDKTVLDSAVITSTLTNKNFVSNGLIFPALADNSTVKKDIVGFISPEFKFNNIDYTSFSKIKQQGKFTANKTIKSRTKINDVAPGSGYIAGKHKATQSDDDGFSIQIKTRDTYTDFEPSTNIDIPNNLIKEVFYLNALEDKIILDSAGLPVDVFNLACDNKIGIISLTEDLNEPVVNSLPYVYLIRENANPYSNFRIEPYYKDSKNPVYFTDPGSDSTEIFNGDSYITSIKYLNSIFYDNRMKKRKGKTSAWGYVVATILVLAAVALTILTFGAATPLLVGATALAVGGALIGGATALVMSGIKQDAWNKAYGNLYGEGLRETITDSYMQNDVDPISNFERGFKKNPEDDEIQWLGDAANLWFESGVNMALRHGTTDNTPDFVNAPAHLELGTTYPEWEWEYFGIRSVGSKTIPPTTSLDAHMVKKLTYLNTENKEGKAYIGLALAELYLLNPDYKRRNKQKAYNHLGIEYDCCSDCVETFPHRWHWSEQSFQEELTDNFRTFLPNNYKDLEGETGSITDIFRIQNNLYIHTEEGLWHCPQTFQERVTSDIVSFIGTGEYFSIPPRKIVDDANSSAGNSHKWGRTKTKFGVLFPSIKEKKWYLFDGQQLKPISDQGMYSEFKKNMVFDIEEQYFRANKTKYPYSNNPSHPLGVGFISTYDTKKERLIITKKDFSINQTLNDPFELCSQDGETVLIADTMSIIGPRVAEGWEYLGVENCQLKFKKTIITPTEVSEEVSTYHPEETVITITPGCSPYIQKVNVDITCSLNTGASVFYIYGYADCNGQDVVVGSGAIEYLENKSFIIDIQSCGNWFVYGDVEVVGEPLIMYIPELNCDKPTLTLIPEYTTTETVIVTKDVETIVYEYEEVTYLSDVNLNSSLTMSYSLKKQDWISWHPYLPSFYLHDQERFYSWKEGQTQVYKHNIENSYQTFYGVYYPFIVEIVNNSNPLVSKIWDNVLFQTEAKKFDSVTEEYLDLRYVTFNKILVYNTQQISGVLSMRPKQEDAQSYLYQQTKNNLGEILIDRNERDWTINELRDYRKQDNTSISYSVPMFLKDLPSLQSNYYIDKIVNPTAIDINKNWTQLESFRDKFLVVRLIFDNFADTRLIFNFSALDKKISER